MRKKGVNHFSVTQFNFNVMSPLYLSTEKKILILGNSITFIFIGKASQIQGLSPPSSFLV